MLLVSGVLLPTPTPENQNLCRLFFTACSKIFKNYSSNYYYNILDNLKAHTLLMRQGYFEALYIRVDSITCPFLLEVFGIILPVRNAGNYIIFCS
jgi:hypothetical protein